MGAFYLVFDADRGAREVTVARLRSSFEEQGFARPRCLDFERVSIGLYGKLAGAPPQFAQDEQGRFVALCGTAMVDSKVGVDAAEALLNISTFVAGDPTPPDWETLVGSFCVISGDARSQRLFLDPLGVYKVYTDQRQRVFASSFLALANTVDLPTPNPQGVYEYVHQEAAYGRDTVLNEVQQASCRGFYRFMEHVEFLPWRDDWRARIDGGSVDEHLQRCLQRLRIIFSSLALAFDARIDTALSGGYDSRLTLALLQEQGVQPAVHVYGSENSADVKVAKRIAGGQGFELEHIDKSQFNAPSVAEFPRVVHDNFLSFDGWPTMGIFDSGVDLHTRSMRASGERLMLNGGGGEIFRNFFYLPEHISSARQVVQSFYNRYSPRWCTDAFDEATYLSTLQRKLCEAVGAGEEMTRAEIEYVYPIFRCGFWMGRNNAINNRLGWAMTPFIDYELVRRAVTVPLALKNHGRFEAAMIRAVSPALAGYMSDYGHDFATSAPVSRVIKDWLTMLRPPSLRRLTYRLRFRRPQPLPTLLTPTYLENIVDLPMPLMSNFFHVAAVNDPSAYARIATLEYLFKRLRVSC